MAIAETPLGYKKPDGNEPARGGDNIIAFNAQKNEDHIAALMYRVTMAERALWNTDGDGAGGEPNMPTGAIDGGTP